LGEELDLSGFDTAFGLACPDTRAKSAVDGAGQLRVAMLLSVHVRPRNR